MIKLLEFLNKLKMYYKTLDYRIKLCSISFLASMLINPWFVVGYYVCNMEWSHKVNPNGSAKKVWTEMLFALIGMCLGDLMHRLIY